jgi:hypothetical protein
VKSVDTLVEDIYHLVSNPQGFSPENVRSFGESLATRLSYRLSEDRQSGELRASNIGKPCDRQLWYDVHCHDEREPLPPAARLKFLFGDILEELLLFLGKEAGHDVRHEQAEVTINGVKGHIDGIIDGRLVDCKSASTYAFEKFKEHRLASDDPFGYIDQLGFYLDGANDRLVDKDVGSFLAIDKTLGHVTLDTYAKPNKDYSIVVEQKKEMLAQPEPPERAFQDQPFQKSGNKKLGAACSYCPFKSLCWKDANDGEGLRTFLYANKPIFLTHVVREPKVPEMNGPD